MKKSPALPGGLQGLLHRARLWTAGERRQRDGALAGGRLGAGGTFEDYTKYIDNRQYDGCREWSKMGLAAVKHCLTKAEKRWLFY